MINKLLNAADLALDALTLGTYGLKEADDEGFDSRLTEDDRRALEEGPLDD